MGLSIRKIQGATGVAKSTVADYIKRVKELTTGVTPTQYTLMKSGDELSKLETPTVINTYLDSNGVKTVCTQVGAAKLVR